MIISPNAPRVSTVGQDADDREALQSRLRAVRSKTAELCQPLVTEDYGVQTIPNISPPKWHLAHTTWFFETFILIPFQPGYRPFHPQFDYLFNSYYETVGTPFLRARRGLLSRPTVAEVYRYRAYVDEAMGRLIDSVSTEHWDTVATRTVLGTHHEQQHQELLLTDIKHILGNNPLRPVYRDTPAQPDASAPAVEWIEYAGGIVSVGHQGAGFVFDNETPRHRVLLDRFRLASRPVISGEYAEFIEARAYTRPELWLADGWHTLKQENWQAPMYWEKIDGRWWHMTLSGMRPVDEQVPVCHVSFYEADAFARWAGKRLPNEAEWEHAAADTRIEGNLLESGVLQPRAQSAPASPQFFGDVWEWTQSAYTPYPGFVPLEGSLGEYNGKFMCNQIVLRGGSCATPASHIRASYRNFFYPQDRWQFSGIRLTDDA